MLYRNLTVVTIISITGNKNTVSNTSYVQSFCQNNFTIERCLTLTMLTAVTNKLNGGLQQLQSVHVVT